MRRIVVLLLLLFAFSLFGCSKMLIEQTIEDFENAVNKGDAGALKEIISEESEFSTAINSDDFQFFLEYFDEFDPVNFYNYDININGSDADVYTDVSFEGGLREDDAWFVMKKKEALFSFIFPDWKIYQYWDTNNENNKLGNVWRKLMEKYHSK